MSAIHDLAARKSEAKSASDFFREHTFRITVWPDAWRNATTSHDLTWNYVIFDDATLNSVPSVRGLYALIISVRGSIMPMNGVLAYFGQTGARSNRTLRDRYSEYLRERRKGAKRPQLDWLFRLWGDDLCFGYAAMSDAAANLEIIESNLNDAVLPPTVTQDFSAEVRREVPVLRNH